MDRCLTIGREKIASVDNVKDTTFTENKTNNKNKIQLIVFGDDQKQELNLNHCTNPITMLVLSQVIDKFILCGH